MLPLVAAGSTFAVGMRLLPLLGARTRLGVSVCALLRQPYAHFGVLCSEVALLTFRDYLNHLGYPIHPRHDLPSRSLWQLQALTGAKFGEKRFASEVLNFAVLRKYGERGF